MSELVEGVGGNREVSPLVLFAARGDVRGAGGAATLKKEGGPRGKHGFPRASEPKASEELA